MCLNKAHHKQFLWHSGPIVYKGEVVGVDRFLNCATCRSPLLRTPNKMHGSLVLYDAESEKSSSEVNLHAWREEANDSPPRLLTKPYRKTSVYELSWSPEPPSSSESRSLYQSLKRTLESSPKVKQEVAMKKRAGFYRLRGQLGAGNFSKVRLGVHLLTNGMFCKLHWKRIY